MTIAELIKRLTELERELGSETAVQVLSEYDCATYDPIGSITVGKAATVIFLNS